MLTLRLTQSRIASERYQLELALEGKGIARQTATVTFAFALTGQDQEDLRWYFEDFLQYPQEPAPQIAARIEKRLGEIGTQLFEELFRQEDDARDLWATLRAQLNGTRVEIVASVQEAATIPWELLRDPKTDTPLALGAEAFVRAHPQPAQRPRLPETDEGAVRILLVICRPSGEADVPFRSVASQILKGLGETDLQRFRLKVLRPATFEQLAQELRAAKTEGKPYHVVHFDGHGAYLDLNLTAGDAPGLKVPFSRTLFSNPRAGAHGYLLFENPVLKDNRQFIDGPTLGKLLVETEVAALVLNACRSAHSAPPAEPEAPADGADPHSQVRALGSLAQEVMDAGVPGVVAMRYNVYVVTAAHFVVNLYASLSQGQTLGEAVTLGRKQLATDPLRTIAFEPRPLQDWPVPVVYEAAPLALFSRPGAVQRLHVDLSDRAGIGIESANLHGRLPARPDAGFFGRDETLLALDRAFDREAIVLLHGFAGSGKTAAASEFARWYARTGGLGEQPGVLFTTFEAYRPLPRVLDSLGEIFASELEQQGVQWHTLVDDAKRDKALGILKQVPLLWVWDNVEPVSGFPQGTPSQWSATEQQDLADFLRAARDTKTKFLLTSRRDELTWLGALPVRIRIPGMPFQERVQLAAALARKHNRRLSEVEDWRPLLKFTQGNPLTLIVVVGQALRDGLMTRSQIVAFVNKLRAGEAAFTDEANEGRSKSLGASLSYGFEHAFSDRERQQLAVLHLFQGFVYADVLGFMGNAEKDWGLAELSDLSREDSVALLNRAADVGVLSATENKSSGYYYVHPAVPWFFRQLFARTWPGQHATRATRAFVEVMGALGNFYWNLYEGGRSDVVIALREEEATLLYAWRLAREHGWRDALVGVTQALRTLYGHTGQQTAWRRLVDAIVPDFVDPATEGPLPGREMHWSLITEYRVRLLREARDLAKATQLQERMVDWDRERAQAALERPDEALEPEAQASIRSLLASLVGLGRLQRMQGDAASLASYLEAFSFAERIDHPRTAAICAFNVGNAYLEVPTLCDLKQAESWYQRSLALTDERDGLQRGRIFGRLGQVAVERFSEILSNPKAQKSQLNHQLNAALHDYNEALDCLPADAVDELAGVHYGKGRVYGYAGDVPQALEHYEKALRLVEGAGDRYRAGLTRRDMAEVLKDDGRLADALAYARAALRDFNSIGMGDSDEIDSINELIGQLNEAGKSGKA